MSENCGYSLALSRLEIIGLYWIQNFLPDSVHTLLMKIHRGGKCIFLSKQYLGTKNPIMFYNILVV